MYQHLITAVVIAAIAPAAGAGAATPPALWCKQGDPPIYASADTTCKLAGNVITDYVNVCHEASNCRIHVESPTQRVQLAPALIVALARSLSASL